MNTYILVLAAAPSGLDSNDCTYPLCLAELAGISVLESIVANTRGIPNARYVFAFLQRDVERFHLNNVAKLLAPGAIVISIPEDTKGSACTALLAASQLDPDSELLIISANELVDTDQSEVVDSFRRRQLDAGTIIFRSVHPRYSYVRLNDDGLVVEATQQNPISQTATAGIFWFAKCSSFVEGAKNLLRKDANVAGKFFVALTFNELILNGAKIGVHEISNEKYHPLKTQLQVNKFEQGPQK